MAKQEFSNLPEDPRDFLRQQTEGKKRESPSTLHMPLWTRGPEYLGVFESHRLSTEQESVFSGGAAETIRATVDFLTAGKDVIFNFEQAGKMPESFTRNINRVLHNPEASQTGTLTMESIMRASKALAQTDAEGAYLTFSLYVFNYIRTQMKDQKHRIHGEIEHPPKVNSPVLRVQQDVYDPKRSKQEKIDGLKKLISYVALRDMRSAGQILTGRQTHPQYAYITRRGKAHVGLVPALQVLSGDTYPAADIDEPRVIAMGAATSIITPILWQKTFWEEVLTENKVNIQVATLEAPMERIGANIRKTLSTGRWGEELTERFESAPLIKGTRVLCNLTQT